MGSKFKHVTFFRKKNRRYFNQFISWSPVFLDAEWDPKNYKWLKYNINSDLKLCRKCKSIKAFIRQVENSNLPKGTRCYLRHSVCDKIKGTWVCNGVSYSKKSEPKEQWDERN